MKSLVRKSLKAVGVDIRAARDARDVMDFIEDRKADVVLDVGANIGQFGQSLRAKGYRGKIISFEPIASVFEVLAKKAKADGNWEAHNFALGAAPGEAVINVSEASVFSSLRTTTHAATQFDEKAIVTRTETIEVRTLDDFAADLTGRSFLKIDTQGYEKEVLNGGRRTLPNLSGVLMELPIIHLYEGNWEFHQAVQFMASFDFIPAQIHPVNYHSIDTVSLVEVDCLFRPAAFDGSASNNNLTPRRLELVAGVAGKTV